MIRRLGDIFHGFLFKPSVKRIAKEIYLPEDGELSTRVFHLQMLPVKELRERALAYRRFVENYDLYALDKTGHKYVPGCVANMMDDGEKSDVDMINFVCILQNPRNYPLLSEHLSEGAQKLLKELVLNHSLYIGDAEKVYGKSCLVKQENFGKSTVGLCPELDGMFFLQNAYGNHTNCIINSVREKYIYVQNRDCEEYMPIVLREELAMAPLDELPGEEGLTCFSGEDYIFTVLPMLESLYDGGHLAFNKNKLPVAQQKAAMRMLCLPEYFADGDKVASKANATFVINLYTLYCDNDYDGKLAQDQDKLKDFLAHVCAYRGLLFRLMLPHVSGSWKALVDSCTVCELSENILAVLKKYADMGWMPIEKFCLHTRCVRSGAENVATLFSSFELDRRNLYNDYTKTSIYLDNLIADVTYPYIKAFLFMLAGFGFVEVAHEGKPKENARSYFEGLRYVRLTNLGKYALGLTDKYVAKEKEEVKCFELDDSNLIAKSVVSPNPYESVLAGMAEHISKKMYKVTYESFLTGCHSLGDIVSRIGLFHDYVCKNPPAVWETFFRQVKERWQPLLAPKKQYMLYQIPHDNKELQRIILSDPVIRNCCVKAEGYLLLVDTDLLKVFKETLLKYGFTMV